MEIIAKHIHPFQISIDIFLMKDISIEMKKIAVI